MQKKAIHKQNILFPSMWQVYRYRMLWHYHFENVFDKKIKNIWETKIYDAVLEVYNYEKYNRVMHGEEPNYGNIYDALQYFVKIGNIEAMENMAWILKQFPELIADFEKSLMSEDFDKSNILKQAIILKIKPKEYFIGLSDDFYIKKQTIIDDIKYLEKEKDRRDALKPKPKSVDQYFYDMAIEDAYYILLGNATSAEFIVDTLEGVQDNTKLRTSLIWCINNFYEEHIFEIMRELKAFKSLKLLMIFERFPTNDKELSEIEKQYFNHICSIINDDNEIGKKVLLAVLKYYKTASNRQKEILEEAKRKSLKVGLEYATELEEYEIADLINNFMLNNIEDKE